MFNLLPRIRMTRKISRSLAPTLSSWLEGYGTDPVHRTAPLGLKRLARTSLISSDQMLEAARILRLIRSPVTPPFEEETALFLRVLDRHPEREEALRGLFLIAIEEQDFTTGERIAERLTRSHPASAWSWLALGWIHSRFEDWERAAANYRLGLENVPADSSLALHLALVLDRIGEREASSNHLHSIGDRFRERTLARFLYHTQHGTRPETLGEMTEDLDSLFGGTALERGATRRKTRIEPCPVCGSQFVRQVHWIEALERCVSQCRACLLYHVNPQPEAEFEGGCFTEDYLGGTYRAIAEWVRSTEGSDDPDAIYGPHRDLLEWLEEVDLVRFASVPTGEALDVGCAAGAWTRVLERRGWRSIGVEPSEGLYRLAEGTGDDIRNSGLLEQHFDHGRFDLIACLHVLSHARQPKRLMEEISRVHKPGGLLLIASPVAGCLRHYLEGAAHFHSPDHLFYFTAMNLESLLRDNGYETIDFRTPEDGVFAFAETRIGNLPWHPLLVSRMREYRAGNFVEVAARKRG